LKLIDRVCLVVWLQDMPLVIRMHSRLYEFIGPRATVWQYVGKTA
jgi:hypothetical protein